MEQRVIKLDIDTAQKWYNTGGELKKVALQAFTEQELILKVRIWEDIPKLKGYYVDEFSVITQTNAHLVFKNKNIALTEKHCKKMLAIAQISQLMPYYGGAITDAEWRKDSVKFVIERNADELLRLEHISCYSFLAFHTREQRSDFLQYNERLVKDYYMMD